MKNAASLARVHTHTHTRYNLIEKRTSLIKLGFIKVKKREIKMDYTEK